MIGGFSSFISTASFNSFFSNSFFSRAHRHAAWASQALSIAFSVLWLVTLLVPPRWKYTCWHYAPSIALTKYKVGLFSYRISEGDVAWIAGLASNYVAGMFDSADWSEELRHAAIGKGGYWMFTQQEQNCQEMGVLGHEWCSMWKRLEYVSYVVLGCTGLAITSFMIFATYLFEKKGSHRRKKKICLCIAPCMNMCGHGLYFLMTWDFPNGRLNEFHGAMTFGYCFVFALLLDILSFSAILTFVYSKDNRPSDHDDFTREVLSSAINELERQWDGHGLQGSDMHAQKSSLASRTSDWQDLRMSWPPHHASNAHISPGQQQWRPSGFHGSMQMQPGQQSPMNFSHSSSVNFSARWTWQHQLHRSNTIELGNLKQVEPQPWGFQDSPDGPMMHAHLSMQHYVTRHTSELSFGQNQSDPLANRSDPRKIVHAQMSSVSGAQARTTVISEMKQNNPRQTMHSQISSVSTSQA